MCKEFIGPIKYRCGCTRNTSYVEACSDEDCGVVRETVRFGKTTKRHSDCEECKSKPKPKFVAPEGVLLPMLARGGSALVYRSSTHPKEVLKVPLKLDTTGCSSATTNFAREDEEFSRQCHDREREIYTFLPPHEGVLASIDASAGGIRFPFFQNGDLRTYLQEHNTRISMSTREQWIRAAVESIAFIHSFNILHCDLSARNFLVADDLSLKLCDFAGSITDGHPPLVSEEVRYRKVEGVTSSTQSTQTELFAIGSLIYEIVTGLPPYADLSDEEIEERYGKLDFPSLENLQYAPVIEKCWTSAYDDVEAVVKDIGRSKRNRDPCMARHAWQSLGNDLTWKAVLVVPFGMYLLIFWSRRWRK